MNGGTGMQKRVRFVSAVILIVHAILSSAAFAAEGKVVWYTRSNPVENAWQRRAIADFRKVNSEITIEHMITPWDQYDQKLTMLFAAETPPFKLGLERLYGYDPAGNDEAARPLNRTNRLRYLCISSLRC